MSASRRTALVAAVVAGLSAAAPAAWSFFSATGAGFASATVATLHAPTGLSATPSGDTVSLSWTAPAAPGGGPVDGFYVRRSAGTPGASCASSATSLLAATSAGCTDASVAPGTYTYTVVAVYRSWTATSAASDPATVAAAAVDHFSVAAPAGATAGVAFDVAVTARTSSGDVASGYTGSRTVVWSGPAAAPGGSTPTYPASVSFAAGIGTASVTLVRAETTALAATEGAVSGSSGAIAVGAGVATQFAVSAPTPQVAGVPFAVALAALDTFGNPATGYSGEKTVAWSGPGPSPSGTAPTYPASVSFAAGIGTASVTLVRAEAATLTAAQGGFTGTSAALQVGAGAASRLAWTQVVVSAGTLTSPCLFTCTGNAVGNFGTFTARVGVTDGVGNVVTDLGAGSTVTVSTPASGTGSGGAFTAPSAGTSVILTIAASGAASSTSTFTFKAQNGNWASHTFSAATASGTAYTGATAAVTKQ